MHRGRLIFPVIATIRQLDVAATRAASGYDDTFREENLSPTTDGLGESMRENKTDIDVPVQIEERDWFERLQALAQGNAPKKRFKTTCLENAGNFITKYDYDN